jgi:hypothetical protein
MAGPGAWNARRASERGEPLEGHQLRRFSHDRPLAFARRIPTLIRGGVLQRGTTMMLFNALLVIAFVFLVAILAKDIVDAHRAK